MEKIIHFKLFRYKPGVINPPRYDTFDVMVEPRTTVLMEKPIGVKVGDFNLLARRWIFPFKRTLGTWAFVLNRWSGVLLALYLYVHLGILTSLAFRPDSYDRFLVIARSPLGLTFDVGLILLLLYHGLNGLRIVYASLAGKIEQQRLQFWLVVAITLGVTLYSAVLLFSYE